MWGAIKQPSVGAAEAIGGYGAGCVAGAVPLPLAGDGFRVARPERGRVWGHPSLIAFLRTLAGAVKAHRLPLHFVGDLGQPRGGPAPSGHASHQTGLDVDLAYAPYRNHQPPVMVDGKTLQKAFNAGVVALLRMAAEDTRVDRIFVNPVIKRALCSSVKDRSWLRKVRPWWGHGDHFHVRLACPDGSTACVRQPELPPGDGCGELDWWFRPAEEQDRKQSQDVYRAKVGAGPDLPERCREVLEAK